MRVISLVVTFLSLLAVLATSALPFHSFLSYAVAQAAGGDGSVYFPLIFNYRSNYNWTQFNGDASHSGSNTLEKTITPANVSLLTVSFQVSLPDVADGAPAYLSNVQTASGTRNLLFVTTRSGGVVALDAATGATVWEQPSFSGTCLVNNNTTRNEACYTTSSPAVDPNWKYVYSYGLDGYVHKYAVADGTEVLTGGWPELTTLKGYDEKGSSDLSIATAKSGVSYLYMTHAGYPGDFGNYQGHLTAINLSDGSQKVFNALCSDQTVHFVDSTVTTGSDCNPQTQSAIWARSGVVYDPLNDRIYMTTGNGDFNPSQFLWGDTVLALNPDGSGAGDGNPLDSFTPTNFQSLQDDDADLGSTAPAILPPAGGNYPHMAVQGGKDSRLHLINLDNMSGQNQVGQTDGDLFLMDVPQGYSPIFTQPAVWVNPADQHTWVFVSNSLGIAGLELVIDNSGNPSLVSRWTGGPGTSPLVADGVLFYATSGLISALDPTTGSLLWSSSQIGGIHWQSPIVVNGVAYQEDRNGMLTAFALP
jgi:hypothetical protein